MCGVGGAVSLGLVSRASCGRRRVMRIADQGVVWVTRAWSGWRRRVIRIGEQGVVWVAPCHWDCCAVSLALVSRASCGRRRVSGIAVDTHD